MYTTNIKSKNFDQKAGRIEVIVEISDGLTTVDKPFYLGLNESLDDLKLKIKAHIDRLETATVNVTGIEEGVIEVSDVNTDVLPDEVAFQTWLADYRKLKNVQTLIDMGVLTGQETAVETLRTKLANKFLPAYLTRI